MTNDFSPAVDRAGQERELAHLIVVAGLKGAGKTTFIRSIRRRTLSQQITTLLPQDAAAWLELPAGGAESWLPRLLRDAPSIPGAILHYDLRHFYKSERAHPSQNAFLLARRLTVVNIRPQLDRLIAQFDRRESMALLLSMPRGRDDEKEAEHIRVRRSETLQLYRTPGWVERVNLLWDAFVREVALPQNLSVIDIEPEAHPSPPPAWRLKPPAPAVVEVGGSEPI